MVQKGEMMQKFIEQIVKEIVAGTGQLDAVRRRMFLIWLESHASQVRCAEEESYAERLAEKLAVWLETLDVAGCLFEYRLVINEIEWWHSLEGATLERMAGVGA
jgi:hypothetical protein